jgi:LysM repeat protein
MAKYTIKKGDTYWGIAKALTGRGGQYNKLVELNHTPSVKLKVGQEIEVPDEWVTPKSHALFKGTPKAGDVIKGDE